MSSLLRHPPPLQSVGQEIYILRWDNFLLGQVSSSLILHHADQLQDTGSYTSICSRRSSFLQHLITITHCQWMYCNSPAHIHLVDGKTHNEHMEIMSWVTDLIGTDAPDLISCRQHFLCRDFSQLGQGSSINRQCWFVQVASACMAT